MATLTLDPIALIREDVDAANALGEKIKAANSDQSEAIAEILASHEDEKIVKYREGKAKAEEQIAKLQAYLEDLEAKAEEIAKEFLPAAVEGFDVEEATQQFLALRRQVTAKKKAFASLLGLDDEGLSKALEEAGITEITSVKGKRSSFGVSTPRPRLSAATVDGKKVADDKGKVTFTSLAAYMSTLTENVKVDADALKAAAFNAAGTRDLSSLPDNTEIKFSFKVGEETHEVSVTTRPKPGPRVKAESE